MTVSPHPRTLMPQVVFPPRTAEKMTEALRAHLALVGQQGATHSELLQALNAVNASEATRQLFDAALKDLVKAKQASAKHWEPGGSGVPHWVTRYRPVTLH